MGHLSQQECRRRRWMVLFVAVVLQVLILNISIIHQEDGRCQAFPSVIQSPSKWARRNKLFAQHQQHRTRRRANAAALASSRTTTRTSTSSISSSSSSSIRPSSNLYPRKTTSTAEHDEEHHHDTSLCSTTPTGTQGDDTSSASTKQATTTTTTVVVGPPVAETTKSSQRSLVVWTALTLLSGCVGGALLDLLPGYWTADGIFQTAFLFRDLASTVLVGALAYAFLKANTMAVVDWQQLQPRDARKIIHTLSAPLYMLFWPLFSDAPGARWVCAVVPLLNALRLILAAQQSEVGDAASDSNLKDNRVDTSLAVAVSRSGDLREALGGPFIYVCMTAAATVLFWRDSPVGVTALSILAAGDGMADLVGRRFGKTNKWWKGADKSVAGSLAFWLAGTVTATGLLAWLQFAGCMVLPFGMGQVALTVAGITLASAIMEVVPWFGDDNYTVPLTAALLSFLFLR